jgi:hypothetical protein
MLIKNWTTAQMTAEKKRPCYKSKTLHTVKKGQRFSRSQSLTKLFLAGNNLVIPGQGEFGK